MAWPLNQPGWRKSIAKAQSLFADHGEVKGGKNGPVGPMVVSP